MKAKIFLSAFFAAATLTSLTACRLTSGGDYAGGGIYHPPVNQPPTDNDDYYDDGTGWVDITDGHNGGGWNNGNSGGGWNNGGSNHDNDHHNGGGSWGGNNGGSHGGGGSWGGNNGGSNNGGGWGNGGSNHNDDNHNNGGGSNHGGGGSSGGSWGGNSNDSGREKERDAREDREREAHDRQTGGGNEDLHPPGEGGRVKPPHLMSLQQQLPVSDFKSTDSRVTFVAQKYDISDYAATYVVRAVELAKADDESGITDLGLTKDDFEDAMKGKKIDADKLQALAKKLLMTTEDTQTLLTQIKVDAKNANKQK